MVQSIERTGTGILGGRRWQSLWRSLAKQRVAKEPERRSCHWQSESRTEMCRGWADLSLRFKARQALRLDKYYISEAR